MNNVITNYMIEFILIAGLAGTLLLLILPWLSINRLREPRNEHYVLHISTGTVEDQRRVIGRAEQLVVETGNGELIEVVAWDKGLRLLMQDSRFALRIIELIRQGVIFSACENTVRRLSRDTEPRATLLEGLRLVPDGRLRAEQLKESGYIAELA